MSNVGRGAALPYDNEPTVDAITGLTSRRLGVTLSRRCGSPSPMRFTA